MLKRVIQAVLVSIAVLSVTPALSANYGPVSNKHPGYLEDASGNLVKSGRTGQCVRIERQWSPAMANKQCEDALRRSQAR